MENFEKDLNSVIKKTFDILRSHSQKGASRLVFPDYTLGGMRVSEQELRFVFVEQIQELLKEYNYFYSVETPTIDKYKFTEQGKNIPCKSGEGQSANFDLTIKDRDKKNIAIIEFKANTASEHAYAKDLCKLWNTNEEGDYRYFICLFKKMDKKTLETFESKLESKDWYDNKDKFESDNKIHVIAQSLSFDDAKYDKVICIKNGSITESQS